jgi:serine/threonine protein kinase
MTPEQLNKLLEIVEEQRELAGRFRNPRRLGANGGNGAFSLIFSAEDTHLARGAVALKFLNPFEPEEYRRQCFRREPEMLQHFVGQRDIIQLVAGRSEFTHTLGGGFPIQFAFYAVELAETDLGSLIEGHILTPRENLVQFRSMCRAVQRLRARGVVHRDVKPSNFLIMQDGTLKLSDFGTARIVNDYSPGLLPDYRGFPPGDWGYAAPEMIASLHDVDPQIAAGADVFGLGASFFEMFTGVPLGVQLFDESFQNELAQVMGAVRKSERQRIYDKFVSEMANSRPLPSIAAFAPDIPAGIIPAIDDLYRSVAALDYRKRVCDFRTIFLKLNRCILILDNEDKFRRWRERRDKEHAALLDKQQRIATVGNGINGVLK